MLNNHNVFTNQRLADIQDQIIAVDGKIVGLQTETRQHFVQIDQRFAQTDQRFAQVEATQYEHTTALTEQKNLLTEILARLPEKP